MEPTMLRRIIQITLTTAILLVSNIVAAEPAADGSLKQIMQQLGKDYSTLNHALLIEDFDAAARAAHAIAYHDTPSLGQRMKVLSKLGSEMPAFKKADDKVHDLAITLEDGAKARDMSRLIQQQSQMLAACMSCHTSYRSRVVNLLGSLR